MNWLAHLYLSEPTPAFRLGNLLPDLVSATTLADMPAEYQPGILCHRRIDAFTDRHPYFRQSIARLGPPYRRFGGIIVDMFYDHILAKEWKTFSPMLLQDFAADVYGSLEIRWNDIPLEARPRLAAMCRTDWLTSYGKIDGIADALTGIGSRLRRPTDLAGAVPILKRDYAAFRADFVEFFPQLMAHLTRH